jgi:hypothetical protein
MPDIMRRNMQALTALLTIFISAVSAHSWVEQLMVIAPNGTFVGDPGYPRGFVPRDAKGFSDTEMTYLIPPNTQGSNDILDTTRICSNAQQTRNQTAGSPRLKAAPGAAVALRYQENGHVTLPQNQAGKPQNRGTVYVYGTTEPYENDTLLAIHKVWNENGTGGDGRGVLLSKQNFDDGHCYQINHGNISEYRQKAFPHAANQLMGANLWCQQDIALPSDAPSGQPYTLYWVWDWPTLPARNRAGKNETYTTCMDIDITQSVSVKSNMKSGYIEDQPLDNAAIPSQFADLRGSGSGSPSSSSASAGSCECMKSSSASTTALPSQGPTASYVQTPSTFATQALTAPTLACGMPASYQNRPRLRRLVNRT